MASWLPIKSPWSIISPPNFILLCAHLAKNSTALTQYHVSSCTYLRLMNADGENHYVTGNGCQCKFLNLKGHHWCPEACFPNSAFPSSLLSLSQVSCTLPENQNHRSLLSHPIGISHYYFLGKQKTTKTKQGPSGPAPWCSGDALIWRWIQHGDHSLSPWTGHPETCQAHAWVLRIWRAGTVERGLQCWSGPVEGAYLSPSPSLKCGCMHYHE